MSNSRLPSKSTLSTDFFAGNIYQQAVALVSRLELIDDIPEIIVVGIQSEQWYQDVVTNPQPFEQYVSREVTDYIDNKYRTLTNQVLVGHSYAGAFVSGALPTTQPSFDLFLSLSPVYPSMLFIEGIQQRYTKLKPLSLNLTIIDGDEDPMDKLLLKRIASQLKHNTLSFNYHSMPLESHMSVFSIGLSHGLREYFSDFRFPSRKRVTQQNFDIKTLRDYFKAKDNKYGSKTDEVFIQNSAISMAHRYTSLGKFEQALPFWRFGQSQFKEYFMGGYADRFIELDKKDLSIQIWKEMVTLFPESDTDYRKKLDQARSVCSKLIFVQAKFLWEMHLEMIEKCIELQLGPTLTLAG